MTQKTTKILFIVNQFPKTSESFIYSFIKKAISSGYICTVARDNATLSNIENDALAELSELLVLNHQKLSKPECLILFLFLRYKRNELLDSLSEMLTCLIQTCQSRSLIYLYLFFKSISIYVAIKHQALQLDLIHSFFGYNGIIGSYLKKWLNIKLLVTHYLGYDVGLRLTSGRELDYSAALIDSDISYVMSNYMRAQMFARYDPRYTLHVMPFGVDIIDRDPPKLRICGNCEIVNHLSLLMVGRMVEKKGFSYAVDGIYKFFATQKSITISVTVIGNGPQRTLLIQKVRELGMDKFFSFIESVSYGKLIESMHLFDLLVAPSVTAQNGDSEGIPVIIMDAFSCALPVISTRHAGIPEIVEDKVNGFLACERSSDDIMSALVHYAQMTSRDRLEMKKKARETVERKYNSCIYFDQYSESLNLLLNHQQ